MEANSPRRHPYRALSAIKVKSLTVPGRYADGNGLYLLIDPNGAKRWVLRTVVHRRRRDIGLGSVRLVSLAEARARASELRKIARSGGDPIAARRSVAIPTFAEAARKTHEEHKHSWHNDKHAAQWINTLSQYVFPVFGDTPVDRLDTPDVMRALAPIWLTKPETARRVKQRIGTVFDWAKSRGFRGGDNPINGVAKGLPRQTTRAEHFQAIPYKDIPGFLKTLRSSASSEIVCLAFEFLILTAARTSEVLQAHWDEVDVEQAIWTIPAARMKARREHRVPLANRAIEILERARVLSVGSDFVFAAGTIERPLSNMVFLMTLRRVGVDSTAHGFRSAFRDWAAECTNFPRDICEMALAHTIKSKAEAAYRRGDLLEKRRGLMAAWEAFLLPTARRL